MAAKDSATTTMVRPDEEVDAPAQQDSSPGGADPRRCLMHAHFDCFSGAAGDMMLAACLDAANNDDDCDDDADADNDDHDGGATRLLQRIANEIRQGLPPLAKEFDVELQRVWRGVGSITALHVNVTSVYHHAAAPVPARAPSAAATMEEKEDGADQSGGGGVLETSAAHSHGHGHHTKDNGREHSHSHHHQHHGSSDKFGQNDETISDESAMACAPHGHSHPHAHSHDHSEVDNHQNNIRNLPEIRRMLEEAPEVHIPQWVREHAIATFTLLAQAEASVHGAATVDAVHFHEVGAVDSIVDTVGTLLALYYLNVATVSCSRLPLGEGAVKTDHGLLPVPAPATLHLMKGMPTTPGPPGRTGELVTPTGAALLRTLTTRSGVRSTESSRGVPVVGRPPGFTLRKTGVGAGSKDFPQHPNILRLMLGDSVLL